ncbi:MAG TPA: oligosaccharide flippase family protein [Dongiaceae bacterium]|nr:oligosaccharide flippase family protein [Dongiaceae bacterium]
MLRESLVYILSRAVPSGIAFVTGMVLTWLLTPADYGVYGLGLAVVMLIAAVFFDWHGLSFMRFYQSEVEHPAFMPTILQTFLLLCLCSIVFTGAAYAGGVLTPDYGALLWICVPGCWCYAWFELAVRMQIARFRPAYYFWMNMVRNVGIFIVVLMLAWATGSPFYVLAGSFLVMLGAGLIYLHPGFSLSPGLFDRNIAARLWAFGWPIAVGRIIGSFSFAADRFLLDKLSDKASVGFYTVAYSLAQMTIATIATGIDSAIYSRAVKIADRNDPEALRAQLSKSCALMLAVTLPASVGVAMVAPALARLAVAPDYVEPVSSLIVWMSAAAFLLNFRANYVDHGFHLGNTTGRLTTVITVMAIANIAGDLLLIPRYGAIGAAQASIIAGVVAMIHGVIAARSSIVLPFPKAEIAKIVLATLAMGAFLWPLRHATAEIMAQHAPPWGIVLSIGVMLVQVGGGAAVFGAVALGLNVMNLRPLVLARLGALRAR